ncbi:cob(I)yrinic acid a,c-diamide adenosyltransferase [Gynuella sunshinyii]|uniref:Corrinoid adenosyltransferase n=1 Tax=Gynuella sunshinyii YC6258 TaxID=1445510 RepID=A0A0C5VWA5_9GAMM|nr:cob(I)yrinic acid a,c-diamide adenosyltransferase [Gynuella sunshinyii]AJQ94714.1 ATP:corrinoid adenosyltransferase [Gynuella sunshinyii YC6258]
MADKNEKHKTAMAKQKAKVDKSIAAATTERGIVLLLTGDGKGKSSSAFGMVMRSLGYGYKVGVIQFIKGEQMSGEELFIRNHHPEVYFYQMGTGFTWNTQDREADMAAAQRTWEHAEKLLADETYHLVVLDEITYMIGYKYLDAERVIKAINERPAEQSVVITGRGGGSAIRELADTVSEVHDVKHAFKAGIKARKGIDL